MALSAALAELPGDQRRVVELHHLQGVPISQVGTALGMTWRRVWYDVATRDITQNALPAVGCQQRPLQVATPGVAADSGSRLNEDPEHGGCAERACFENRKKKSGDKSPHSKRGDAAA